MLGPIARDWVAIPHDTPLFQSQNGFVFPAQRGWTTRAVLFDATNVSNVVDETVEEFFDETTNCFHLFQEQDWVTHFHEQYPMGSNVSSVIVAAKQDENPLIEKALKNSKTRFAGTIGTKQKITDVDPQIRGPHGVARVELLPGAKPKKERPF